MLFNPSHPGEVLKDYLGDMTVKEAAMRLGILVVLAFGHLKLAKAQDNYEIQVYGSDTVAPKTTMLELHSNFTAEGSFPAPGSRLRRRESIQPTMPSMKRWRLLRELNGWSEIGFYIFTSARSGDGWQWVGDHIRPRVRAPDSWHWPVGVSLSMEFGYQRAAFSTRTHGRWNCGRLSIRQIGRWYFSVNPALERSFHGPSVAQGIGFSPSAKFSYDFNKYISGGLEYYAAYGSIIGLLPLPSRSSSFFPRLI